MVAALHIGINTVTLSVLLAALTSASSFIGNANPNPSKFSSSIASVKTNMATSVGSVKNSGGRGSGASSWPPMQRVPIEHNIGDGSSTSAIMNYVSPETTEMYTRRDLSGSDSKLEGVIWSPTLVNVADARLLEGNVKKTLDANGFELWEGTKNDEDATTLYEQMDYCHQDQVVDEYYPMCEQLVSSAMLSQGTKKGSSSKKTPIACVCAFDHNVRSSSKASVGKIRSARHLSMTNEDQKAEDEAAAPQVQNPAGLVHADYTKISAPRRLLDLSKPPKLNDVLRPKLMSQNKKSLLDPTMVQDALDGKRRYAFVNVWRNIDTENPVKNHPLACIDAKTTTVDELRTFKIHYVDRVGENYFVCGSKDKHRQHSWYYYPDMTIQEAMLLKQWDSRGGVACGAEADGSVGDDLSTFTIHSAFIDPRYCPDSKPPRKSIEVRCVVIWEEDC